jgi:D-lactate dehydrogenase
MKVGVFSCKQYERAIFESKSANYGFELVFIKSPLNIETVSLAKPFDMVCVSVEDEINAPVLEALNRYQVIHTALRCVGFNNIDLEKAKNLGISVSRVNKYTAESVAEHTVALIMALNRKLVTANHQILNKNVEADEQLGFNLRNKTVGIIGTGAIGSALITILAGFGCRIVCVDPEPSEVLTKQGIAYVDLPTLIKTSDIISLHCPLTAQSQHMIGHTEIGNMKENVMIINTSRGGLMNTKAIISGLKSRKIGYLGIDMHEMESALFSENITCESVSDDINRRLATFHNVLITYHQGFFTQESMEQIIETTLINLQYCFAGKICKKTYLT